MYRLQFRYQDSTDLGAVEYTSLKAATKDCDRAATLYTTAKLFVVDDAGSPVYEAKKESRPRRLPSLSRVKEVLREAAFDPRGDGPSKVIVDVVVENPRFAEARAVELINEARLVEPGCEDYHYRLNKAIGLLALARAVLA